MTRLGVRSQRWLRAFHIFLASVWTGATFGSVTVLLAARSIGDANTLHGFYTAAGQIGSVVIPATSVLTLITGLLICRLTAWGFFKYWSVIFQGVAWLLVFVIAFFWLDPAFETAREISGVGGLAASQTSELSEASRTAVNLSMVNAAVLAITFFVAAVKPWGRTRSAG